VEQQIHIFSGSAESGLDSCLSEMKSKSEALALRKYFVHDSSAITWVDQSGKHHAQMVVTYRKDELV
tara:strand:+ start:290 stop:490 length:201 start_codon:yes stop_codon:yes gene_type:complete